MKYFFIYGLSLLFVLFYIHDNSRTSGISLRKEIEIRKTNAIGCSPLRDKFWSPADIPLLPGTGLHQWKISTTKDSAQVYFDQGMNLYYSFHIIEALGSFLKAQQFDPQNGMLYWAEALSYGPNINDAGYAASPGVFPALKRAAKFQQGLTETEKGLITALATRYSKDSLYTQERLNIDYRDAMEKLHLAFPKNPEVTALYVDALMLIHPWDLYDHNQLPKTWTDTIVEVLEEGLKIAPNHPGINHYYIHAVEASSLPSRALSSAKKLGSIAPSVSHMVHMPSHIYIRTGNYDEGINVNVNSLKGYDQFLKIYPSVVNGAWLYDYHNVHLLAACAMMKGDKEISSIQSKTLKEKISQEYFIEPSAFRDYVYYMASTPVFSAIRFGQWDQLITMPEIEDSATYLKILSEFGRGIAFARTKNLDQASNSLNKIQQLMKADQKLTLRFGAFNTAYSGVEIAEAMLKGIIEEEKGNYSAAISSLQQAVTWEEYMIYNEPKDWILSPLPYLGQVLLKNRNFEAAENAFRKDLAFNPGNCWSLKGLAMTLYARGKNSAASATTKQLDKALKGTGLILKAPVY